MKQPEPIKISDIAIIQEALIELINTFPELPPTIQSGGVLLEQLDPKKVSMCLTTMPTGNVKLTQYICGKYRGRYNFAILFQKMSTSNSKRINAEDILGKLGSWLEKSPIEKSNGEIYQLTEYPSLGVNREIERIERTSFPRIIERAEPNIELLEAAFYLDFIVKP